MLVHDVVERFSTIVESASAEIASVLLVNNSAAGVVPVEVVTEDTGGCWPVVPVSTADVSG